MREFGDRPEALELRGEDWTHNEQRLQQAQDAPMPAVDDPHDNSPQRRGDGQVEQQTWRYYDSKLGGHVYTHLERPNALKPEAVATLHKPDGTVSEAGRLGYALDKDDCMLRGYTRSPEAFGVESALQSEVSERARQAGVHNMQVWVPDGEPAKTWSSHGFLEDTRSLGAQGVHWNRRL